MIRRVHQQEPSSSTANQHAPVLRRACMRPWIRETLRHSYVKKSCVHTRVHAGPPACANSSRNHAPIYDRTSITKGDKSVIAAAGCSRPNSSARVAPGRQVGDGTQETRPRSPTSHMYFAALLADGFRQNRVSIKFTTTQIVSCWPFCTARHGAIKHTVAIV